jgi:hypothetical protein
MSLKNLIPESPLKKKEQVSKDDDHLNTAH